MKLHAERLTGSISMFDSAQPYDPEGTIVALYVDMKDGQVVRCPLSLSKALALASALIRECMSA